MVAVLLTTTIYIHLAVTLGKDENHRVIIWDMFGYYLYLPAMFIYHDLKDLDFMPEIHTEYNSADGKTEYGTTRQPNGNRVMKYTAGLSILYSPFFFAAHEYAKRSVYKADGFSRPYQFALVLCGLFYALLGLLVLGSVLLHFFKDWIVALVIVLIAFGTNYYFYVVDEGMMSHNYLFLMLALVLWATIQWHRKPTLGYAVVLGVALGFSILIRPTEVLFAIIPIMWGIRGARDLSPQLIKFKSNWPHLMITGLFVALICSIQLTYWKYATGHLVYFSYKGEGGFNFLQPHIWQGLFSFKKGWLVYTPVMVFALLGIWFMRRQLPEFLPGILIFSVLYIYVVFSWNPWWYGGSFGMRAMVQTYALYSIPLACLATYVYRKWHRAVLFSIICSFFIYMNLYQSWQRQHNIIHWEDMHRDWYWDVFLKEEHSKRFSYWQPEQGLPNIQ